MNNIYLYSESSDEFDNPSSLIGGGKASPPGDKHTLITPSAALRPQRPSALLALPQCRRAILGSPLYLACRPAQYKNPVECVHICI